MGPKNVSQGLGLSGPDFENFSCRMIPTPSHGGELRPSAEDTQLVAGSNHKSFRSKDKAWSPVWSKGNH